MGKPWIYGASVARRNGLVRLGSEYGGWDILDHDSLYGSTIFSAGLGEDASFDIEFAQKYSANVVIIDPTPRALQHYGSIAKSLGQPASRGYATGGAQPIGAYDLAGLSQSQLTLIDAALWNENGEVTFFAPKDEQHVSHSIVNYQNGYRSDTPSITVTSKTFPAIASELGIDLRHVPLVKLDIEGAEIEVVQHMLDSGFLPRQICVEFDELHHRTKQGLQRVENAHQNLLRAGYRTICSDGFADFLYARD